MKLEIIKEEKFNEETWYGLKVNDTSFQYSRRLEEIEKLYQELKDNPDLINTKITVLKSEEI